MEVLIENDRILDIKGFSCERGAVYAQKECISPTRMLTSTVRVKNGKQRLVPVKTDKPIPKALLMDCMRVINRIEIIAPVAPGDILLDNILNTGVNIIASWGVEKA
jgi:CxxC motif-containing protein